MQLPHGQPLQRADGAERTALKWPRRVRGVAQVRGTREELRGRGGCVWLEARGLLFLSFTATPVGPAA